jgi:tetratricopeptide (TPR) repeat protein
MQNSLDKTPHSTAPTPPVAPSLTPIGLWFLGGAVLFSAGLVASALPVESPPDFERPRGRPTVVETIVATSPPASPIATEIPPSPSTDAPAATPPPATPPAVPATDAADVKSCAAAAERLASTTSYDAAITAFEPCLALAGEPESIRDLSWRYAKLLWDGYREGDARRIYEAVLAAYPDVPQSRNRLAWYLLTTSEFRSADQLTNDRARALRLAEEAVRLTNRQDNRILDTLAEALLQSGRQGEAMAILEEIVTLTGKPIYPARLEQFVAGKSRHMQTQEYSEAYRRGEAWTARVAALYPTTESGLLRADDILALSPVERCTLRNAIYARRGQRFGVRWLDDLFQQQPWYRQDVAVTWKSLTPLDKKNVNVIVSVEAGKPLPDEETSEMEERSPGPTSASPSVISFDEDLPRTSAGESGNGSYQRLACGAIRAPSGTLWYVGPDEFTPFHKARTWVANLTACGGQWRLPNPGELAAIYEPSRRAGRGYFDGTRYYPAHLDPVFTGIGSGSWAWSSIRDNSGNPKALNLYTGGFVSLTEFGRALDGDRAETTVRVLAIKSFGISAGAPE